MGHERCGKDSSQTVFFRKNAYLCPDKTKKWMATHNELGTWGEDLAVAFLQKKGYVIIERNWRSGHRDIDIIALHNDAVVFVEVKTRRNQNFVYPVTAINYMKLRNLRAAINHYVKYRRIDNRIQFDVVTIVGTQNDVEPIINHLEDISLY